MSKWVPLGEWVLFPILATLATIAGVGAILTPQDWNMPKVMILAGVVMGFWLFAVGVYVSKLASAPDFILRWHQVHVWTNGIPEVTEDQLEAAIELFLDYRAGLCGDNYSDLREMFDGCRVEFTEKPFWYGEKKYSGMQSGQSMKVWWGEGFEHNAFFHECTHMMHEWFGQEPDYKHTSDDWKHVGIMKQQFAEANA